MTIVNAADIVCRVQAIGGASKRSMHARIADAVKGVEELVGIIKGQQNTITVQSQDIRTHFERANKAENGPVPMLLTCPICRERHIDEGEFATKLHHTHACQHCGHVWRPTIIATVGVRFLPGFKNEEGT